MNNVQEKAEALIRDFRDQTNGIVLNKVTLKEYCGDEIIGIISLTPAEIEDRIRGYTYEGFKVTWSLNSNHFDMKVQED